MVNVEEDPHEASNRTITVYGKGGLVPSGGSEAQPLELFVGNAGTAARFLAAFVVLGKGVYRLHGVARMHERPQAALFQALRSLGYQIDSANDRLPAVIHGGGPRHGKCQVSIEQSSQFASALLLCAQAGGWQVSVSGIESEEAAYVTMTEKMIRAFPRSGGLFEIEPDASSGSYFMAIPYLGERDYFQVAVAGWPQTGWQIDEQFPRVLKQRLPERGRTASAEASERQEISRARDLGDSIMTAIAVSPAVLPSGWGHPLRFTNLGRLRLQECERVNALRTELTKCGARVMESGDTLEVFPSNLHGAEIETYNDHRMAMCFAILGLKVPGIKIKNPRCVKKTFPNFFQKLAAPPPAGVGVVIRNPHSGQALAVEELLAE